MERKGMNTAAVVCNERAANQYHADNIVSAKLLTNQGMGSAIYRTQTEGGLCTWEYRGETVSVDPRWGQVWFCDRI